VFIELLMSVAQQCSIEQVFIMCPRASFSETILLSSAPLATLKGVFYGRKGLQMNNK